ncbi:thioredoxin-like domain-containing protein [Rhodovulum euryhalinum]|uniref:Methylamine dehydrogenase accessory protein MauD n=1 Tax=Rhodovulum euryhalinum TaxID=35805 RepID=A0A4R2KSB8_9RHOB|nr:thioredoxin-like domain-containing protein [Rhodovulum euryhalinum]TCO69565.1 methylamine dehydrogenase accessory protein MauD [Rhodovulum euryhalinum]
MTTILTFLVAVLFVIVIALTVALFALARQVGVLFERIAPMGALVNDSGPRVGQATPRFTLASLTGPAPVEIGPREGRATLVFFLSPTCPVCKKLLPILKSARTGEAGWLDIVLASDGEEPRLRRFIQTADLTEFPFVNSTELGLAYRVSRLPFAVLLAADGTIRSKGLINSREQLDSLFNAHDMGVDSIQSWLDRPAITA